jgi:hypothetical protein
MYAIKRMEHLLLLLLDMVEDPGVEVEVEHDGSKPFNAFEDPNLPYGAPVEGGRRSDVHKKRIRIRLKRGDVWISWYYDARRGEKRWGAGSMTIRNEGVERLIELLEHRRQEKVFWLACSIVAGETSEWEVTPDERDSMGTDRAVSSTLHRG